MTENQEKIPFIRDSKGRIWAPRITCRNIKNLEQKTGKGLLGVVFSVIDKKQDEESAQKLMEGLFGSIWHLCYFVWDGCIKEGDSAPLDDSGEPISFDDFCDSITHGKYKALVQLGIEALCGFFKSEIESVPEEKKDQPASKSH